MSTVQGYQCDHCGAADLKPYSFPHGGQPEATRGWYVSKAIGTDTKRSDLLWFCTTRCAVAYLKNVRGGDCWREHTA